MAERVPDALASTLLFDKVWAAHAVRDDLLYIDLHMVHEVCSPQAFEGLRLTGRRVRRPDRTLATADHNTPTDGTTAARLIRDQLSREQVEALERNCQKFRVPLFSLGSAHQGIVHVIAPELGVTQPGMTIVCGDSYTAMHGAFGALAFGVGTGRRPDGSAFDVCEYSIREVERIARAAFRHAGRRVTSIDKANVLETSRLWREVVERVHVEEFPEIELRHLLVDNAAFQLVARPDQFDGRYR